MQVVLPTIPYFLHTHFSKVRGYLLGYYEIEKNSTNLLDAEVVRKVVSKNRRVRLQQMPVYPVRYNRAAMPQLAALQVVTSKVATSQVATTTEVRASAVVSKSFASKFVSGFLSLVVIASIVVSVALFLPKIYYAIFPADIVALVPQEAGTPLGGAFSEDPATETALSEEVVYEPPFNPELPEGDWIIIPRIGVRTELRKTVDPEEALQEGVWWVPDWGDPGDTEEPLIAAAHRYGWDWWWQSDYWKYNSFYLLPDTQPGDRIEVISGQRKWVYEIYAGEEGEEITDYTADMILYTCKFLQSPVRHFRYARLIDPTVNTQVL